MNIQEQLAKQAQVKLIRKMQARQKASGKLGTVITYLLSINHNSVLDQSERAQLEIAIDKLQAVRKMLPRQ